MHITTKNAAPALVTLLLGLLLAACNAEAPPPPDAPAPPPAPAADPAAPLENMPGDELPSPESSEPAPSPPPEAPPPTEPSAVPKPTSTEGLDVRSMQAAIPSTKISVPVELRYQLDGAPEPGRPVTLHLAALPRVAGSRLQVSVKPAAGLAFTAAPLQVAKVAADGVYRQQFTITRRDASASRIRVLVTMDLAQGSGFGFFTIPLDGDQNPQKVRPLVKQR